MQVKRKVLWIVIIRQFMWGNVYYYEGFYSYKYNHQKQQ